MAEDKVPGAGGEVKLVSGRGLRDLYGIWKDWGGTEVTSDNLALTYVVVGTLPTGLAFDTRVISGTPRS